MDPVTTSATLATSYLSNRTASRRAYKVPAIRHNLEDFLPDSDIITLLRVDATFFEDVVPSVWAQAPVEAVLACDPKVATKEKEAFRHRLYCSCVRVIDLTESWQQTRPAPEQTLAYWSDHQYDDNTGNRRIAAPFRVEDMDQLIEICPLVKRVQIASNHRDWQTPLDITLPNQVECYLRPTPESVNLTSDEIVQARWCIDILPDHHRVVHMVYRLFWSSWSLRILPDLHPIDLPPNMTFEYETKLCISDLIGDSARSNRGWMIETTSKTSHIYDVHISLFDLTFLDCAILCSSRPESPITGFSACLYRNNSEGLDQFLSVGNHLLKLDLDLLFSVRPQSIVVIMDGVRTHMRSLKEFRFKFTIEADPQVTLWPLTWSSPENLPPSLEHVSISYFHPPTADDLETPGRLGRLVDRVLRLSDNLLRSLDCEPFVKACQKVLISMQELIPHIPLDGILVSHLPIVGVPPLEEVNRRDLAIQEILDEVRQRIEDDIVMCYAIRRRYLPWVDDNDLEDHEEITT
ncbi:hypothetical protein M231_07578 [Tremella mesenterica]|uniref:Uncharacterized protein n=1 Tax=Tremella mesenterica TaxID=5217 RepID=A0A4Q1BBN8_TREME|nr:hypothetical protein M231_07578 [Tremella mesenterica]